jgi:cupin superfamily acireductone dioxygenase involved in methionine salvage
VIVFADSVKLFIFMQGLKNLRSTSENWRDIPVISSPADILKVPVKLRHLFTLATLLLPSD